MTRKWRLLSELTSQAAPVKMNSITLQAIMIIVLYHIPSCV